MSVYSKITTVSTHFWSNRVASSIAMCHFSVVHL